MSFDTVAIALRMREAIKNIVADYMQTNHVDAGDQAVFARVKFINRFANTADVIMQGDSTPITVTMTDALMPARSSDQNYSGNLDQGDIVVLTGPPGRRRISGILHGPPYFNNPQLKWPRLMGGQQFERNLALFFDYHTDLPAVGNTWHAGRWDNSPNTFVPATGLLWIEVHQGVLTSGVKFYEVPLRYNGTAGAWVKVAPAKESGTYNDDEFCLELMVDTEGFELRVRRLTTGTGQDGYAIDMWAYMEEVRYYNGSANGEEVTTEPTRFYGVNNPARDRGMLMSPMYSAPDAGQFSLTGASRVTWDGASLLWTGSFVASGIGRSYVSKTGYFAVDCPAAAVNIPVHGKSGTITVATTVSGIPLINRQALYYDLPLGDSYNSVSGNFHIVDTVDGEFQVPAHWILIAQRNPDGTPCSLKLGTGELLDHWREVGTAGNAAFNTGWSNFASGHETVAYRMLDGRCVKLKGLVKQATATTGAVNSTIFTLPVDYRPSLHHVFATSANNLYGRFDILSSGAVMPQGMTATQNVYVSLAPAIWYLS